MRLGAAAVWGWELSVCGLLGCMCGGWEPQWICGCVLCVVRLCRSRDTGEPQRWAGAGHSRGPRGWLLLWALSVALCS